ncbi:class I SAM-dependent methyltransferase [Paenibacillus thalictri]|uniref:Class I SAM-dependent methyltransferase n=1 Tax=Paenibacillus thalictri TaxID=2527873 RepID=A0A4Q9DW66_9BACL|nr:class I SAM-dependent methyltransferase [Paenibacillus thalictri]TBL80239.1 class I SAM-dependent methyltransferase [Paenibacillus thalictri]
MDPKTRWEQIYAGLSIGIPVYDDWLEKHQSLLRLSADLPVIDLGCGYGCDTLYLVERGYRVIACDFSQEALKKIADYIPEAATLQLDLRESLPFADGSAMVIVADLSLHYFSWADTQRIVSEIGRVLQPGGVLLCRVNSVGDVLFGAGQGKMIEPDYYETEAGNKRFFTKESLELLFQQWDIEYMQEAEMHRYGKKKLLWEAVFRKL